jgi:hypothetical protein
MDDNCDPVERYLQGIDQAMMLPVVRQMFASETVEIGNWRAEPIIEGSMAGSIIRLIGTGLDRAEQVTWSLILKEELTPLVLSSGLV